MLFFRTLGKLLLFVAFLALAYDGARMLATPGEGLFLTSLSKHLRTHAPGAQESLQKFIEAHAPNYLWHGLVEPLLILPLSIVCGGLGAFMFLTGYRPPPPEIVSDEMRR